MTTDSAACPRRGLIGLAACAVVVLSGCTPSPEDLPVATWRIDDASPPEAESLHVDVLVTRLECSGGVTGDVGEPTIDEGPAEVVVSYTVEDLGLDAATCPGNPEVPATFELAEPLGDRRLVDGQCATGLEAARTSACTTDVRWEP
ncbi:hypothetical protein [Zhihengliuella salsuginis]|uniref:Ig-like domain-containing protein n=1 Tax=Zhihengliuella salsuginis TaxID=578222 RepID=A0ABQ3GLA3_9MICC|nr:hypothetical protein [Zhihengliuella salsuginis]GHD12656.1 hypothetical protein GCM10008096_28240 [Zhihengliuella salsuginis]